MLVGPNPGTTLMSLGIVIISNQHKFKRTYLLKHEPVSWKLCPISQMSKEFLCFRSISETPDSLPEDWSLALYHCENSSFACPWRRGNWSPWMKGWELHFLTCVGLSWLIVTSLGVITHWSWWWEFGPGLEVSLFTSRITSLSYWYVSTGWGTFKWAKTNPTS